MLYRSFIYLLGMLVNFFGVALLINATLGAGFWTSFFIGVTDHLGYTVGFWYGTFQLIIIFVNAVLMKQKPEVRAAIPVLLESLILDFWLVVVFSHVDLSLAPYLLQVSTLLAGVVIIGLGVAIYILPQFPRAPVDQLFLAVSARFNLSIQMGQSVVAVFMTTLAFLIGGPVGLGTIAPMLFLGPVIQYSYTRAYPLYYKLHPQGIQDYQEAM
ncbi:YczE/YyaS/YitT family protein [Halobacillus sp. B23F22_1]|uniref:YczE/YyaS/YitT family protein n=1 Tax=Halobacillus sp. B23F22_1 TaxID=3459514 RepID=UPI00373E822B